MVAMKAKQILIAGIASLSALASCQKAPLQTESIRLVEKSFTALQTKTVLDANHHVLWKSTDCIGLFNEGTVYQFTTDDSGASATFTGMIPEASSYFAIYPYQEGASCNSDNITAIIPTEQTAVVGSFADGANLAVGTAQDGSIEFKNICGLIQLEITRDDIKSVKFEGLGNEQVAGQVNITVNAEPSCNGESGSTNVLLSASGDALVPGVYHIAVRPQTYAGFKLTFTDINGSSAVKSSAKDLTIARSGGMNLGKVDEDIQFISSYSIDLSGLTFSDSFIYEAKDGDGNVVAIICKEFLTAANQQGIVVYGIKPGSGIARVMDSANPVGLVARVLKSGAATQYETYSDVEATDAVHGGIYSFKSDVMNYITSGAKTAISVVYATYDSETGISTISDQVVNEALPTTLSPRTLVLEDRGEEKTYKLAKIGRQIWMAENLVTAKFNDGTAITKAAKAADLAGATGAMYVAVNTACYAYNGDVVLSGLLAPSGWKVPTKTDATTLLGYAGNMSYTMNFAQNNVTGFSSRYKGRVTSKWDNTLDAAYWCSNAKDSSNKMQCFVVRDAGTAPTTAGQSYKYGFFVRLVRGLY